MMIVMIQPLCFMAVAFLLLLFPAFHTDRIGTTNLRPEVPWRAARPIVYKNHSGSTHRVRMRAPEQSHYYPLFTSPVLSASPWWDRRFGGYSTARSGFAKKSMPSG